MGSKTGGQLRLRCGWRQTVATEPGWAEPRWAGPGWGWAAGGYPAASPIWNALAKRLLMKCRLTSGRHPPIV